MILIKFSKRSKSDVTVGRLKKSLTASQQVGHKPRCTVSESVPRQTPSYYLLQPTDDLFKVSKGQLSEL